MTIIHRYLLLQFVRTFLIFFISFTGLYIVIDAFGNLDNLIEHGEANNGIVLTIVQYYGPRVLFFFDRASGMLILVAAMFTIASFQRHNELTALLAAGVSERRVIKPLFAAALVLCIVAALNREVMIPAVRESLSQDAQALTSKRAQPLHPTYDNASEILLSGKGAIAKDKVIVEPDFYLPKHLAIHGNGLRAEQAVFEQVAADRPSGYRLINIEDHTLAEKPSFGFNDRLFVLSPYDTAWLNPNELFVVTQVDFHQLTGGNRWRQYSSTWELISAIHNPSLDYGANVRVTIHGRVVQPFLDMTLLFLGVPLVLTSKNNRHKLMAIGKASLLLLVFMFGVLACQYLGSSYLISPALAAWLPLLVFVPGAVWLFEPLRDPTRKRRPGNRQPQAQ